MSETLFPILTRVSEQGGTSWLGDTRDGNSLAASIADRYKNAIRDCADLRCLADGFKIRENEKQALIAAAANAGGQMKKIQVKSSSSHEVIPFSEALSNEIISINYILDVYVAGEKPRYPKIDRAIRLDDAPGYMLELKEAVTKLIKKEGVTGGVSSLPRITALKVLSLNGRDEAGRYEPITTLNKAALKKARSVKWDKFEFSAILVPGLGPQKAGIALDPGAAKRCDQAAAQYKKGVAPFIIVSGGHVHPVQTPYSEAIEMRKYLVQKLKIPPEVVIAEPYARHTTTNIRNAVRLVYKLGLPEKLPVRIVTDFGQSTFIMFMGGRFLDELGYLPYEELSSSKTGEPYFFPSRRAMQINPFDPLDP